MNLIDYCNNLYEEQNNELIRLTNALNDTSDTLEDMKKEYDRINEYNSQICIELVSALDRIYYLEREIKQLKENNRITQKEGKE